jgi:hypothetical protein
MNIDETLMLKKIGDKLCKNLSTKYKDRIEIIDMFAPNSKRTSLTIRQSFAGLFILQFSITVNNHITYVELKNKVEPLIKYMEELY